SEETAPAWPGARTRTIDCSLCSSSGGDWADRLLLRGEELRHPAEELVQHHPGDAAQHALPHARDEAADLNVGVVAHSGPAVDVAELHLRVASHEAGAAGSLDRHPVTVGRLQLVEPHLPLERALHRTHTDLHDRLVLSGPRGLELLAARDRLGECVRVLERRP